ncbi:unnamed protein product, partial [Amoebophrya sp. A25]
NTRNAGRLGAVASSSSTSSRPASFGTTSTAGPGACSSASVRHRSTKQTPSAKNGPRNGTSEATSFGFGLAQARRESRDVICIEERWRTHPIKKLFDADLLDHEKKDEEAPSCKVAQCVIGECEKILRVACETATAKRP